MIILGESIADQVELSSGRFFPSLSSLSSPTPHFLIIQKKIAFVSFIREALTQF
jgi:hypothetical protein